MAYLSALWRRFLGMSPRTAVHWRAWAVEQAVASGAKPYDVERIAHGILAFVLVDDEPAEEPVAHLRAA